MSEVTCSIGEDIVLAVFLAHKFDKQSLFSKFPKDVVEMEMLGFALCPSIDLIWHTHLLHTSSYDNDLEKYFFTVPAHKLLEEKDRTLVFFNDRDDHQEKLWRKEFHESLFDYATLKSNIVYLSL